MGSPCKHIFALVETPQSRTGHWCLFFTCHAYMSCSWPITQCPIARTWESAPKTMSRHGECRGQIADFRDSFEMINWLYLLFKCGIKTKTHFEWLLWHWSSLGQLNLEPTRPNGLMGCKVPTDLVKISVKEATHMGFYYITITELTHLPRIYASMDHGALVQIMAWRLFSAKPLSKPMLVIVYWPLRNKL